MEQDAAPGRDTAEAAGTGSEGLKGMPASATTLCPRFPVADVEGEAEGGAEELLGAAAGGPGHCRAGYTGGAHGTLTVT